MHADPMEELMQRNVGTIDRTARIVVGLLLLAPIFVMDSPLRWYGLIGVVPLATGLLRWCPAYALLGIATCGASRKIA
jgi:hypothetical protein